MRKENRVLLGFLIIDFVLLWGDLALRQKTHLPSLLYLSTGWLWASLLLVPLARWRVFLSAIVLLRVSLYLGMGTAPTFALLEIGVWAVGMVALCAYFRRDVSKETVDLLVRLHTVTNELAATTSIEEFCRQCIVLGREALGFDRMSLWLVEAETGRMVGTFGTSDTGEVVDERDLAQPLAGMSTNLLTALDVNDVFFMQGTPLLDGMGKVVGRGDFAAAPMQDGIGLLGCLSTDNLILHNPISQERRNLLRLYGTTIGRLYVQKRTEETLRTTAQTLQQKTEILRLTQSVAQVGGWVLEFPSNALYWTDEMYRIYETEPRHFTPDLNTVEAMLPPESLLRLGTACDNAIDGGGGWDFEIEIRTFKGRSRLVQCIGEVEFEAGVAVRAYGAFIDITDVRSLEVESERLFTLSRDLCCAIGQDGFLKRVNPACVQASGYSEEELLSTPWVEFLLPEDLKLVAEAFENLERGVPIDDLVVRFRTKEREVRWLQWRTSLIVNGRYYSVARDITNQRQSEDALRLSERRFRDVTEAAGEYIWEMDLESRYTFLTERVKSVLGYAPNELLGRRPSDLMPPEEVTRVRAWFTNVISERKEFDNIEHLSLTKEGKIVVQRISGKPILDSEGNLLGYRGVGADVTERRRMQEQLLQAQKMESVGRLAGGVAHDFNNLLTAIMGYTEMVQGSLEPTSKNYRYLGNVLSASEKASKLTQQMLAFARKQRIEAHLTRLSDLTEGLKEILVRLLEEDIQVTMKCPPDLWAVMADPHQIEQVLVNLAVNARDAMPHGGTLAISMENVVLSAHDAVLIGEMPAGEYVRLSVRDSGEGMSEEVTKRLFEPFFTTKPTGKGTGLGLAMCHGIVKQHNGSIVVESVLGSGTCITIYLPQAIGVPITKQPREAVRDRGGSETLLLAEDELLVREVAVKALEEKGYRVLAAANGEEALRIVEERGEEINLLITDVIMPQMGGKELADRLSAQLPQMKTLFVSGYPGNTLGERVVLQEGAHFLPKPYTPELLAQKARDVLDGAA